MTAALVLVLVAVLAAAVTVTHRTTDRQEPPTMTTESTTTTTPLPDGHDDPASLTYVPEQLRDYWPTEPLDRLDERDALAKFGDQARADVLRRDPDVLGKVFRHFNRDPRPLLAAMRPSEVLGYAYGEQGTLPPLTDAESSRAVHLAMVARAGAAFTAERDALTRAQRAARHVCPVCGAYRETTAGPWCEACDLVAAALRVEELRAAVVADGRTRAAAVTDYVTAHPDALDFARKDRVRAR